MKSNYRPRPPGRRGKGGNINYTGRDPQKPGGVPTFEDGTPIPWSHPSHPRFRKRPPKPGNH